MVDKYQKTASEILEAVGNKENVVSATHCATRLRLALKNDDRVDYTALENIDLVKGNFNSGGQLQIILGTGIVDKVSKHFLELANMEEVTKEEVKEAGNKKMNVVQRFFKTIADIFIPILPALVASGLLLGLDNVFTAEGLIVSNQSLVQAYPSLEGLADMINVFASAGFFFLPILIGFYAAQVFGATPVLGAIIGAIMIHPDLLNGNLYGEAVVEGTVPYWNIFGFDVAQVAYHGTVLPVIVSVYILAVVERMLRKIVPEILDNILTPMISVLITGVLTFFIIGPVMRVVGDTLTDAVLWLFFDLGALGGFLYAFIYPILVVTGMHHSLVASEMQILANIETLGGSPTFAVVSNANVAQGAAAIAIMYIMYKDEKLRSTASASGISAFLGITEPAIFGINLRFKYAFFAALIGGGIGSAYATLMNVLAVSQGPAGVIGVIAMRPDSMFQFLVSTAVTIIVTFALTILFSKFSKSKES